MLSCFSNNTWCWEAQIMFLSAITVIDLDPDNKRVIFPSCDIPVQCKNSQPVVKNCIFFPYKLRFPYKLVFTFRFTLHYSLHVVAALLYVSFQDADFFCRDLVQHNLLVTVFLSRSLAQLKLKMTSVFLIWTLKKKTNLQCWRLLLELTFC